LPSVDSGIPAEQGVVKVMVNQKIIRPALKANAKIATEAVEALSETEVLALRAKIDADGEAEVAGFKILSAWLTFKIVGSGAVEGKTSFVVPKDVITKMVKPQIDIKACEDETKETAVAGTLNIIFPNAGSVEGVKSKKRPVIEIKNLSFQYGSNEFFVLSGISGNLCLESRVAICGGAACGKSTLVKMICAELKPMAGKVGETGEVVRTSNLRLAFMGQDHMKTLAACSHLLPAAYISKRFQHGFDEELQHRLMQNLGMEEADSKACSEQAYCGDKRPLSAREIKKHLKSFGFDDETSSNQKICDLSASQMVCLSLAALFWTKPHYIAVDEIAKDLDAETLEAVSLAFQNFKGGILMIEHNADFVGKVCTETWTLKDGQVTVGKTAVGVK